MPQSGGGAPAPPGERVLRARYRRIMRFAARALVQAWWFELVLPRIGLRGTAKIYAAQVTLGYYLLRKPIAYIRRSFGV